MLITHTHIEAKKVPTRKALSTCREHAYQGWDVLQASCLKLAQLWLNPNNWQFQHTHAAHLRQYIHRLAIKCIVLHVALFTIAKLLGRYKACMEAIRDAIRQICSTNLHKRLCIQAQQEGRPFMSHHNRQHYPIIFCFGIWVGHHKGLNRYTT